MLKVSQRTEYAMRALIELALRPAGGLVPAREIAAAQAIPLRFLEQQLATLHKAGLVVSSRGAGGGCRLARPAAEIRVADVVDAVEGPFFPMYCLEPDDHSCGQGGHCGLQGLWEEVRVAVRGVFERTNLAELAQRHARRRRPIFSASELGRPLV